MKVDLGGLNSLKSAPGDRQALVKEALTRDATNKLSAGVTVDATVTAAIGEDGVSVGKADVKGLGGTVRTVPGGYDVEASLTSLKLEDVLFGDESSTLSAGGATVEGLRASAQLRETKSADGASSTWSVTVPQLHLDRIAAARIRYHQRAQDG